MPHYFRNLTIAAIVVLLSLAGCVSTAIQLDWRDPAFNGKFRKILVIVIAKEMIVRNTLEADIAEQFAKRGVEGVPSNTQIESLRYLDREQVRRIVNRIGADGVFLVRPVGHEVQNIWDLQGLDAQYPLSAEVYRVEASLFEAGAGQVVWRAISDTIVGGGWMDTLREFARVMAAKMIERGII